MSTQLHDFEGRGKKFINPRAIMSVADKGQNGNAVAILFGGTPVSIGKSAKEVAEIVNKIAEDDDDE